MTMPVLTPAQLANLAAILAAAPTALATNTTFLALATPNTAQAVAQVQALTRQVDGIIRIMVTQFDAAT
jgi:hypothetical protein